MKAKSIKGAKLFLDGKELADVMAFNLGPIEPHALYCESCKVIGPTEWKVEFVYAPSPSVMLRYLCDPLVFVVPAELANPNI